MPSQNACSCEILNSQGDLRSLQLESSTNIPKTKWTDALKSTLISKISLVPSVNAAAKSDGPPAKPPNMRYKDLQLYESSYTEYLNYKQNKYKCPDVNKKLMHSAVLPYVSVVRETMNTRLVGMKKIAEEFYKDNAVKRTKNDVKAYCRDSAHEAQGQALVSGSTLLAFYLGYRKRETFHKGFFFGSLAALFTGWLCFPEETDKNFRNAAFYGSRGVVRFYNFFCSKRFNPSYGPCETNLPEPKDQSAEQDKLCPKTAVKGKK